jgi:hypothetical protein
VYTVIERGSGKPFWLRLGTGFVNRDGSLTLKLDALPFNGTLQVREWEVREEGTRKTSEEGLAKAKPRRDDPQGRRAHDLGDGPA